MRGAISKTSFGPGDGTEHPPMRALGATQDIHYGICLDALRKEVKYLKRRLDEYRSYMGEISKRS